MPTYVRGQSRHPTSYRVVNIDRQCELELAPWGTFAVAHSRPPCASMIERQIESPMPIPPDLVVKKALNSRSAFSVKIPTP